MFYKKFEVKNQIKICLKIIKKTNQKIIKNQNIKKVNQL